MSVNVTGVTRYYGSQKALDNVSFEIQKGEIAAFIGPNGAGKSTMMKIITGFLPASEGSVKVCGHYSKPGDIAVRRLIGYLPENNPLYPEMYVREYLGYVAEIYSLGKKKKKAVDGVIEMTGLGPEQHKKIMALSKGYRQRVGLAQALIHDPAVLILDEATTGLDPNQIVEIRNLISGVGKEKTIMLSTHIMQEVEAICNRIIIIDKGRIIADGSHESVTALAGSKRDLIEVEFNAAVSVNDLMSLNGVDSVIKVDDKKYNLISSGEKDIRPLIFEYAVSNSLTVLSLHKKEESLEDTFRQLTGK